MMLTLQRYDLKVKYRPGVELSVADSLSRSYLPETVETLIPDLEVNEIHLTTHLPISPGKYVEIQQATAADPVMQALTSIIPQGWPKSKKDVPHALRQSHQGIVKCKQRARDTLFWPGMSSQIEDKVSKCSTCSQFQRAQPKEPMVIQELPDRPWAKIVSDLFELNGAHYLQSVDYYSKWIEIAKLNNINSYNVICHLKSQFAKYSIPDELISDNGPQYSSLAFK